ncbi:hypothetical protein Bra471DRAFT_00770 [Bradyrhizobium sp. WSM471]|nr:hypothetical protein Bra471DRAFT_00770 [Bradyrhizobium sp. WSM471]
MCPVPCEYLRRARACDGEVYRQSGTAPPDQRPGGGAVPLGRNFKSRRHLGEGRWRNCQRQGRGKWTGTGAQRILLKPQRLADDLKRPRPYPQALFPQSRSIGVSVMRSSPSIVPAIAHRDLYLSRSTTRRPAKQTGLRRPGFAASASPMPLTWRYSSFGLEPPWAGLLQPPPVTQQADLLPDAMFRDYLWGSSIEPGRVRGEWRSPRSCSRHRN